VQLIDEQEINPTVLSTSTACRICCLSWRVVNIRLGQSETEWQSGGRPDPA
jgi:hypothetical protein